MDHLTAQSVSVRRGNMQPCKMNDWQLWFKTYTPFFKSYMSQVSQWKNDDNHSVRWLKESHLQWSDCTLCGLVWCAKTDVSESTILKIQAIYSSRYSSRYGMHCYSQYIGQYCQYYWRKYDRGNGRGNSNNNVGVDIGNNMGDDIKGNMRVGIGGNLRGNKGGQYQSIWYWLQYCLY